MRKHIKTVTKGTVVAFWWGNDLVVGMVQIRDGNSEHYYVTLLDNYPSPRGVRWAGEKVLVSEKAMYRPTVEELIRVSDELRDKNLIELAKMRELSEFF